MILSIAMLLVALLCFAISWRMSHQRKKLMETGSCLQAKIVGTVDGRGGTAYVVEYKDKGEKHKIPYPKKAQATPLPVGKNVVLYLDKEKNKAYIEGDDGYTQAEKLFLIAGEILLGILLYQLCRAL